jgi:hypothetical protein
LGSACQGEEKKERKDQGLKLHGRTPMFARSVAQPRTINSRQAVPILAMFSAIPKLRFVSAPEGVVFVRLEAAGQARRAVSVR